MTDFHDIETHYGAWREALIIAQTHASGPDSIEGTDDKAYWQHEINVYDRVMPAAALALNDRIKPFEWEHYNVTYYNSVTEQNEEGGLFWEVDLPGRNYIINQFVDQRFPHISRKFTLAIGSQDNVASFDTLEEAKEYAVHEYKKYISKYIW